MNKMFKWVLFGTRMTLLVLFITAYSQQCSVFFTLLHKASGSCGSRQLPYTQNTSFLIKIYIAYLSVAGDCLPLMQKTTLKLSKSYKILLCNFPAECKHQWHNTTLLHVEPKHHYLTALNNGDRSTASPVTLNMFFFFFYLQTQQALSSVHLHLTNTMYLS